MKDRGQVADIALGVFAGMTAWFLLVLIVASSTNWGADQVAVPVKFFQADGQEQSEAPLAGPGGPAAPVQEDEEEPDSDFPSSEPEESEEEESESAEERYGTVERCQKEGVLSEEECVRQFEAEEGSSALPVVLIVVALVLVGAIIALVLRRRGRT